MSTPKQIAANRRNAQNSTGPKSAAGKSASSLNALQTGIHSAAELLPFEDREAHDALVAEHYASFRPTSPAERSYLDDLIRAEWTLRRLRRAEAELYSFLHETSFQPNEDYPLGQPAHKDPKVFSSLQWRVNSTRKARKLAIDALRALREKPIPGPIPNA